jgi:NAD(P)H dehydrogenase (quinone)
MRVAIIFDHPYTYDSSANVPHERSFTAAVAAAAVRGLERAGHQVDLFDLVADGFDPVMTRDDLVAWRRNEAVDPQVLSYQSRLALADHIVFAFPIWWESMPHRRRDFSTRC